MNIYPDFEHPFVIHTCPDCETLRREREPWMHQVEFTGDLAADFAYEYRRQGWSSPYKIELIITYTNDFWHSSTIGRRSKKTIIRSPDQKMLALAKMFLNGREGDED